MLLKLLKALLEKMILDSKKHLKCFLDTSYELLSGSTSSVFLEFLLRIGYKNTFTKSVFDHFKSISKQALRSLKLEIGFCFLQGIWFELVCIKTMFTLRSAFPSELNNNLIVHYWEQIRDQNYWLHSYFTQPNFGTTSTQSVKTCMYIYIYILTSYSS